MVRIGILAGFFAALLVSLTPAGTLAARQGSIDGIIVYSAAGRPVASTEVALSGSGLQGASRVTSDVSGRF
jgi:hypothetical protein